MALAKSLQMLAASQLPESKSWLAPILMWGTNMYALPLDISLQEHRYTFHHSPYTAIPAIFLRHLILSFLIVGSRQLALNRLNWPSFHFRMARLIA